MNFMIKAIPVLPIFILLLISTVSVNREVFEDYSLLSLLLAPLTNRQVVVFRGFGRRGL